MLTLFKGFLIGIGKIIPGVSGSLIAISLGVYEKCIDIISNIKTELKYNIKYLWLLCLGILIGIVLGSKILYIFIHKYYVIIMLLFVGLILGTIPNIYKKVKIKKNNIMYMILPILLLFILSLVQNSTINIEYDIFGYFIVFLIGFIDAVTMIIPGISGTAVFMILGVYDFVLLLLSNIFNIFIIPFFIGLVLGIFVTGKVINYCFKNFYDKTYLIILSLVIYSLIFLLKSIFIYNFTLFEFIFGILLCFVGFFVTYFFDKN